jgi:hypothetical protein
MVVATMVAFDAAEYVTFTTIRKQIKNLNLKGASETMNVQDFIRQAKAKQSQGAQAVNTAAAKVKEVVTGILPVSHNTMQQAIDVRTVDILTVIAMVEQRMDNIEETFLGDSAPEFDYDARACIDRVTELMQGFIKPKAPTAKPVIEKVIAQEPAVIPVTKVGRKFDKPIAWDHVSINAAQE